MSVLNVTDIVAFRIQSTGQSCRENCLLMQINDRYEFPDQLDLDVEDGKFLSPDADRNVRNLYKLHSVLVHSGGVHGGHYFAYIRPSGKQWLRYDDERVSPIISRQLMPSSQLGCGLTCGLRKDACM